MEWLNFHHLRYFWLVAREGSVSRAAAKLRVSQPTVGEQVHALQEALGEKLLRREGRGVTLTEAGARAFNGGLGAMKPHLDGMRAAFTEDEFKAALPFLQALRVWLDENR